MNDDGHADLVVAATAANALWLLTGSAADGLSRVEPAVATCASPSALTLADFNVDGVLDVAVACSFANQVAVHVGGAVAPSP